MTGVWGGGTTISVLSLSLSLVTMTHQYDSSGHVGAEYHHQLSSLEVRTLVNQFVLTTVRCILMPSSHSSGGTLITIHRTGVFS